MEIIDKLIMINRLECQEEFKNSWTIENNLVNIDKTSLMMICGVLFVEMEEYFSKKIPIQDNLPLQKLFSIICWGNTLAALRAIAMLRELKIIYEPEILELLTKLYHEEWNDQVLERDHRHISGFIGNMYWSENPENKKMLDWNIGIRSKLFDDDAAGENNTPMMQYISDNDSDDKEE